MKKHTYNTKVEWTGNLGEGTANYKSYDRDHEISVEGKYDILKGSSDPLFNGDGTRYNPEDMFVSSISSCHMLWYLHLCSVHKIVVMEYIDYATGVMEEAADGSGQFANVTLNPKVVISDIDKISLANQLHAEANKMCFIANSCNFKIDHKPSTTV